MRYRRICILWNIYKLIEFPCPYFIEYNSPIYVFIHPGIVNINVPFSSKVQHTWRWLNNLYLRLYQHRVISMRKHRKCWIILLHSTFTRAGVVNSINEGYTMSIIFNINSLFNLFSTVEYGHATRKCIGKNNW